MGVAPLFYKREKLRKPREHFIGQRPSVEGEEGNGASSGAIDDNGAIQGRKDNSQTYPC